MTLSLLPCKTFHTLILSVLMLTLAACGGGGGNGDIVMPDIEIEQPRPEPEPESEPEPEPEPEVEPEPEAQLLPFPLEAWNQNPLFTTQHYGIEHVPTQTNTDAQHMPTYHDVTCHAIAGDCDPMSNTAPKRRLFVGVDQGEGVGALPIIGERGAFDVRHGRVSDGAGAGTVSAYVDEVVDRFASGHPLRYRRRPLVRFGGRADAHDINRLVRAVQLVNVALPSESKMHMPSATTSSDLDEGIYVEFMPASEFPLDSWGTTRNISFGGPDDSLISADILINKDYSSNGDRQAVMLLAHELIHALGMFRHVSPHFDSIMEVSASIYATRQGALQPMSLLYPVDREALRALYGGHLDDDPGFGPWASTSMHVHANGEHAAFGVALRNGYAEPWAYGYLPESDLADNPALTGTATWEGILLGFTPESAPVAGDAEIGVNLNDLTGRADFTGLESWAAGQAPGEVGTGNIWGDGDLGYSIAVIGNTFRQTGGDAGTLTGAFFGESHEGMGGVLERAGLTAAFGGKR